MNNNQTEILFETLPGQGGDLGVITLNRPQVLNSLNHNMVRVLHAQLSEWARQPQIKAVLIQAAPGRAFCAGGDIRHTYDAMRKHDASIKDFFRDEYKLNSYIFHYPKPYIALLNGITMGGGVGISIHGSHRIATDQLLFAMPETGIGFFPDVGGTYFLPRLPGKSGLYFGLTGARLKGNECVLLGIATHKMQAEKFPDLIDAIKAEPFTAANAKNEVTNIINRFAQTPENTFSETLAKMNQFFSNNTMEAICADLAASDTEWAKETLATLEKKSPTSLKVTLAALQAGRQLNFNECMQQEYRLVNRFLAGHDFAEGIRAVIIDKDQQPHWKPDKIQDVSQKEVAAYFEPLSQELALSTIL